VFPGVPPGGCGVGFVHDGRGGCVAVLPPEPCPGGMIAVPGDETCREVSPCGEGRWGDIPVDSTTEHVDASYGETDSDGSAERPWPTIGQAVGAAAPEALVAVAAGSYAEDVVLAKAVTLWGKCPAEVELVGQGQQRAALMIGPAATGAEVRGLAVTGSDRGIEVSEAVALLDQLWIHDTGLIGIVAIGEVAPAELDIRDSLIEGAGDRSVTILDDVAVTVDRCLFRDEVITGSLQTAGLGIYDYGAGTLQINRSVLERHLSVAVVAINAGLQVQDTVVRDLTVDPGRMSGVGLWVASNAPFGAPAQGAVRGSVIERVDRSGIYVAGASVSIERTSVRDIDGRSAGLLGLGIAATADPSGEPRAGLSVQASIIERANGVGLATNGADVIVASTILRDMLSGEHSLGSAMELSPHRPSGQRTVGTVDQCLIQGAVVDGIYVLGSDVMVTATVIDSVAQADDMYGDGISSVFKDGPATVWVHDAIVGRCGRAGITSFGGEVWMSAVRLDCNPIQMNGEPGSTGFGFHDEGGNWCGCGQDEETCQILSTSLEPPPELPPL